MTTIRLSQFLSLWTTSISDTAGITYLHCGLQAKMLLRSYYTLYRLGSQESDSHDADAVHLFKKAFRFLLQVRKQPSARYLPSYFLESIMLALIVAEKFHLGIKAIICALLYKIVKAGQTSLTIIKQEFNDDIAYIIQGLIWISDNPGTCSHLTQALTSIYNNFSYNHLLMVLLNLVEKIQQLYMIESRHAAKQVEAHIVEGHIQLVPQIESMYVALVKNLGLRNLYLELTDICFKIKNPTIYNDILVQLQSDLQSPKNFLKHFANEIYSLLQVANIDCSIQGRTKSIASIHNKIQNRGIAFSAINDFYAICIVFESTLEEEFNNCWYIYNLLVDRYRVDIKYLRDWISKLKNEDSSYTALHLTIESDEGLWVEVQIRTSRMHYNAEYGDAAHWKYKDHNAMMHTAWEHISWIVEARDYLQKPKNTSRNISIMSAEIYTRSCK